MTRAALLLAVVAAGAGFGLGMQFQKFLYVDICLDMGGGRNPGGHPICVVTK